MYKKPLPSVEQLRQLFLYNPDNGVLTYRQLDVNSFDDLSYHGARHLAKVHNTKHAHKNVSIPKNRAAAVKIAGKLYYAHRIIWKIQTGLDPDVVDHINGDRSDNRWSNLRNVTQSQNMKNLKIFNTNTSGYSGIRERKLVRSSKWEARYAQMHLGTFDTKEAALKARTEYADSVGYVSRPSHSTGTARPAEIISCDQL